MKRRTPLRRRVPVKPVNRERRAERLETAYGPQAKLCRELPCCACGRRAPSEPAHVRSRGAGGKDRGNVLPLCRTHHGDQHTMGWKRFAEERDLDVPALLAEIEAAAYP